MAADAPPRGRDEQAPLRSAHFQCFDGLRAIAALCVIGVHVGGWSGANAQAWFGVFTSHLNIGVTIFFLISGFLLYRPHAVAIFGGPPAHGLRGYALRRFLRIVPAYWVALTLLGLWPGLRGVFTQDWWVYYGFFQSYYIKWVFGGIPVAWSLSVEVAFYAVLPLLALGIGAACRGRHTVGRLGVQLGSLAVLGLVSVLFVAWARAEAPIAIVVTLPALFLWFALGMGLAVVSAWMGGRERDSVFARWVASHPSACWAMALALFAWVGISPLFPRVPQQPESPLVFTLERVLYGVISWLLLLPAVFGEREGGWPRRMLASRVLSWIGKISYGIFLWHQPLLKAMAKHGVGGWIPGHPFLSLSLAILPVALLAGWVSFRFVEEPAMRLCGGFRRARRIPSRNGGML